MTEATLYDQLVKIIEQYLGPAASRFVDRQIELNVGHETHEIGAAQVAKMRDSTAATIGLLTHDKKVVSQIADEFNKLTENQKG